MCSLSRAPVMRYGRSSCPQNGHFILISNDWEAALWRALCCASAHFVWRAIIDGVVKPSLARPARSYRVVHLSLSCYFCYLSKNSAYMLLIPVLPVLLLLLLPFTASRIAAVRFLSFTLLCGRLRSCYLLHNLRAMAWHGAATWRPSVA